MSRIDDIKRRVERLKYFQNEVDNMPPNPEPMETGMRQKITMDELRASERIIVSFALNDVPYLLSKLEIAIEALDDIANMSHEYAGFDPWSMVELSKEALKQIRS